MYVHTCLRLFVLSAAYNIYTIHCTPCNVYTFFGKMAQGAYFVTPSSNGETDKPARLANRLSILASGLWIPGKCCCSAFVHQEKHAYDATTTTTTCDRLTNTQHTTHSAAQRCRDVVSSTMTTTPTSRRVEK